MFTKFAGTFCPGGRVAGFLTSPKPRAFLSEACPPYCAMKAGGGLTAFEFAVIAFEMKFNANDAETYADFARIVLSMKGAKRHEVFLFVRMVHHPFVGERDGLPSRECGRQKV